MTRSAEYDTIIRCKTMEEALLSAEFYTNLDFEVTTPRSYDDGKSFEFTASWDE